MVKGQDIQEDSKQPLVKGDDEQCKTDNRHCSNCSQLNGREIEIKDDKFIETIFQVFQIADTED